MTIGDDSGGDSQYVSFTRAVLFRYLVNVRYLRFPVTMHHFPPRYHHLLRRFPVTELKLTLRNLTKGSIVANYQLIWSLPALRSCEVWVQALWPSELEHVNHDAEMVEALVAKREKHGVCNQLDHLYLHFHFFVKAVRSRIWFS